MIKPGVESAQAARCCLGQAAEIATFAKQVIDTWVLFRLHFLGPFRPFLAN